MPVTPRAPADLPLDTPSPAGACARGGRGARSWPGSAGSLRLRSRRRPARPLVLLTATLTAACATWQPRAQDPAEVVGTEAPNHVRLHLGDHEAVELRDPRVSGDSISGLTDARGGTRALALTDVTALDVRTFDAARTVGMVALSAAGVVVFFLIVGAVACGLDSDSGYC